MWPFKSKSKRASVTGIDVEQGEIDQVGRPSPATLSQLRDGRIKLGAGLMADPKLTEASLVTLAGADAKPSVGHGPHQSYVLPAVSLLGRAYTPSVYFTNGLVAMLTLTWADPTRITGDPWANWSAERERAIAKDDAKWLATALQGLGSMTDTYTFEWGTVWSGYDEKSGFSSIGLRYNRT